MLVKLILSLFLLGCFVFGHPKLENGVKGTRRVNMHNYMRYRTRGDNIAPKEQTKEYWQDVANEILEKQRNRKPNTNIAKNVIMFLGDGMSIPTLAAARVYLAQQLGQQNGEELNLSFEKFPYAGLSKTYCIDSQVADSACSATAYLCGIKANIATIGVSGEVPFKDCNAMNKTANHVDSILRLSQLNGKRTGVVTTARLTCASPSGTYGHTANRDWESDAEILNDKEDPTVCRDLAHQLVHFDTGASVNVFLGGGYVNFIPKTQQDPFGTPGKREDGEDLIETWKANKQNALYKHVTNREELLDVPNNTEYVLGVFSSVDLPYNLEKAAGVPKLSEMTEKAIKILSQEEKGYFLFVEGARIDHGHHQNKARAALDETVEMHKAIEKALEMVNTEETLIVVTADHSHTMSISGYPYRGNNILGIGGVSDVDSKDFSTLSYANGPGFIDHNENGRIEPTEEQLNETFAEYPAGLPLQSETHGGDDVGIFAIGPYSHFLDSVVEQNFIARVMMYASCVGDGLTACNDKTRENKKKQESY